MQQTRVEDSIEESSLRLSLSKTQLGIYRNDERVATSATLLLFWYMVRESFYLNLPRRALLLGNNTFCDQVLSEAVGTHD